MKTPVRELIENINHCESEINKDEFIYYLNMFLEKEKQIIVDAYNWGLVNQMKTPQKNMNGVDYFKEKFND